MKKDLCLVVRNNYIWRNNLKMTLQNLLKQIIYILWWLTVNLEKEKNAKNRFLQICFHLIMNLPHAGYQIESFLKNFFTTFEALYWFIFWIESWIY